MLNGIICINKPSDFTSFDVVKKLRGITKVKKIGHAGTLDPMATGVLPIFLGVATKACDILPNNDKRYTASFKLGFETDTEDIWGTVTKEYSKKVAKEELLSVLPSFKGEIMQIPPMYSAIQINGKRLYDLARQGIEVEREARKITVYSIELLSYNANDMTGVLDISCSKGTYIRTIISDIGKALGCGGVMTALNRTEASGFTLDDTMTFGEVEKAVADDALTPLPVEKAFAPYPDIHLSEVQTRMFSNGVTLDLRRIKHPNDSETARIYGFDNTFLGLATLNFETNELKLLKFFIERK